MPHLRVLLRDVEAELQECQGAAQQAEEEEAEGGGGGEGHAGQVPQVGVRGQHQEVQLPLLHRRKQAVLREEMLLPQPGECFPG